MDDGLMTGRALCVELAILDLKVALNTGLAIRQLGQLNSADEASDTKADGFSVSIS
jgi:hypothetical protein